VNATTGNAFVARLTGPLKNLNHQFNNLLSSPTVGIHHADCIISDLIEQSNDQKRVARLGKEQAVTNRREKMYVLHSMATPAGYVEDNLATKTVTIPTELDSLTKHIGLSCDLPEQFTDITDDDQERDEQAATDGLHNFLQGIEWEDEDVPIDADQFEEELTEVDDWIWTIHTSLFTKKSTMDTFCRLTKDQPWVPFKKPREPRNDTDQDAYALFDSMYPKLD